MCRPDLGAWDKMVSKADDTTNSICLKLLQNTSSSTGHKEPFQSDPQGLHIHPMPCSLSLWSIETSFFPPTDFALSLPMPFPPFPSLKCLLHSFLHTSLWRQTLTYLPNPIQLWGPRSSRQKSLAGADQHASCKSTCYTVL